MRDKLQSLVEDLTYEKTMSRYSDTVDVCTQLLRRLNDIIATEQPAATVKAGWLFKDRHGFWWDACKPELFADGVWARSEDAWVAGFIIDPWPDQPDGGPDCLLEVKS